MAGVMDSLIYQVADQYFDRLAAQLRAKLESLPPSGNSSPNLTNLYQEFRQDFTIEASDLCADAWQSTLHRIMGPMITELPIALRRVLYIATNNGGEECLSLDCAEDIVMSGPWIEQAVISRLELS